MNTKHTIILLFLISLLSRAMAQNDNSAAWEELKKHNAAPEWFADAKLGVYFHWGVYSVPGWGSEWYPRWMYVPDRVGWGSEIYAYHKETYGEGFQYHDFIPSWKAENFNAEEWLDMFEDMGAKFVGSIAEHHDGFSLWNSKVNEWNSVNMGPGLDIVEAIALETRKRDLKFMTTFHHGFNMMFYPKQENTWLRPVSRYTYVYDSVEVPQDEVYRQLYGNMHYQEACDLWLGKLNEVIEAYCPDYIWMDFGQRFLPENYRLEFLQAYFKKAEEEGREVVVNTKGEFFPRELAVVNVERATMQDITPDVWITDFILGSAWSYNQAKRTAIDPHKAIRMLADVVSKNGVMLLSAGPMADGTIPEEQVKAMEGIGKWMRLYGEAIYSTRPFMVFGEGPTILKRDPADAWNEYGAIKQGLNQLNAADIRYTTKDNILYAILLGWPGEGTETLLTTFAGKNKGLKIKSITVLGSEEKIRWNRTDQGLKVYAPAIKPAEAEAALVYKIVLK